jgi:Winged helix-turn-helix DNA-binding
MTLMPSARPGHASASPRPPAAATAAREHPWSLFSNHGLVFIVIARDPRLRMRDIADRVGITERAAHRLVADLCEEGFVSRTREGRRTRYRIHPEIRFRHPALCSQEVGTLLRLVADPGD